MSRDEGLCGRHEAPITGDVLLPVSGILRKIPFGGSGAQQGGLDGRELLSRTLKRSLEGPDWLLGTPSVRPLSGLAEPGVLAGPLRSSRGHAPCPVQMGLGPPHPRQTRTMAPVVGRPPSATFSRDLVTLNRGCEEVPADSARCPLANEGPLERALTLVSRQEPSIQE